MSATVTPATPVESSLLLRPVSRRLYGLDWLRAGATLLVVTLHAGIAYLVAPMPELVWSTHDPMGSLPVDALTWWIDGFIMPLFFVLSGYVALGLMRRKGVVAFVKHRSRRLLGPLLLGCVLVLPLDLYVWLLGFAAEGKIPLRKLQSLKIEGPIAEGLWGVSHLWFLQYLWLFCMTAAALTWWQHRRDSRLSALPSPFTIPALLTLSALALWWEPTIVVGFRHSWWPLPANVLFYAPWFATGWLMAQSDAAREAESVSRQRSSTGSFTGAIRVAASLIVFAVLWRLIHRHVSAELIGPARVAMVVLFVLHAWLAVSGWFHVCVTWLDRKPPQVVSYVGAASFWIYLFHHPVVGLAQVSLRTAAIPVTMKFAVTLTVGLALPLLTYEAFVRRTWVGLILNGHRDLPSRITQTGDSQPIPFERPVDSPQETRTSTSRERAA